LRLERLLLGDIQEFRFYVVSVCMHILDFAILFVQQLSATVDGLC
jgi:hypothetical protein